MNLSDDNRRSEGGIAEAVAFGGHNNAASAQFTVGSVGFGPSFDDDEVQLTHAGWRAVTDGMAASIVRLECEADELRARVAVLEEEQKIFVRKRSEDARTMQLLREARDRYKRMAGISSDWDTMESVREKFSAGEGEACGDE